MNLLFREVFYMLPLLVGASLVYANNDTPKGSTAPAADNTGINRRDQHLPTLTAEDQSFGSAEDTEITRKIRRALMQQKNLSIYAKNVKVITFDGEVTLRGPVNTLNDKETIAGIARRIAGSPDIIHNELEIVNQR